MKVALFNGSPKKEGNTHHALKLVADVLEAEGVEIEIHHVGDQKIQGCLACNACARNRDERCVVTEDPVNDAIQLMKEADAIILGSPVHYAGVAGTMKSFLDRVFYVAGNNGNLFRHKVGAGLVAVRRSGGVTAFNQLNHYLLYSEMMVPGSNYWNVIHGRSPGEVLEDKEGVQIMEVLGKQVHFLLEQQATSQTEAPEKARKVFTHFIR